MTMPESLSGTFPLPSGGEGVGARGRPVQGLPPHSHPLSAQGRGEEDSPFHVPALLHFLGGLVQRHPAWCKWLGRLESSLLAEQLRSVRVRMPIYVCGLARSGSTLLHEV